MLLRVEAVSITKFFVVLVRSVATTSHTPLSRPPSSVAHGWVALLVLASVCSMAGVALVSVSDSRQPSTLPGDDTQMLLGDLLALGGAFMYGVYTTLLKKKIGHEDRIDMRLFFGKLRRSACPPEECPASALASSPSPASYPLTAPAPSHLSRSPLPLTFPAHLSRSPLPLTSPAHRPRSRSPLPLTSPAHRSLHVRLLRPGFVGVFNVVLLWPGFLLLHYTGLEPFELPSSRVLALLILNAVIGTFVSDYLWLLAMLMTSPVVVTLGLSLTIPLAILADWALGDTLPAMAMYWSGALLILASFVVVNLDVVTVRVDGWLRHAAASVRVAWTQRQRQRPEMQI